MHPQNMPTPAIRAKVVRVGNSVGVRLPAALHLELGTEVEVTIRPVNAWPAGYFDMDPIPDFAVPERRPGKELEARMQRLFGEKRSL